MPFNWEEPKLTVIGSITALTGEEGGDEDDTWAYYPSALCSCTGTCGCSCGTGS